MLFIEPQWFFLHVMQLLKYNRRGYDQDYGNSKLYYHQRFSKWDIPAASFE